jgi:hypothetical protein
LRYHLYCHYFPLWAMGQYVEKTAKNAVRDRPEEALVS